MSDLNEDERQALLAAMYDIDDDGEEEKPAGPKVERPNGIMNMPLMSSKIRKLEETVEAQARALKRAETRIRRLEQQNNVLTKGLNAVDSELDNKLDRRTF